MLQLRNLTKTLIRPFPSITTKPIFPFSISPSQQPPSKVEEFMLHINQIQEESSFTKAAEMLAELQSDEELYRRELLQINEAIAEMEINEPAVVSVVRKRKQIMHELHSAREES